MSRMCSQTTGFIYTIRASWSDEFRTSRIGAWKWRSDRAGRAAILKVHTKNVPLGPDVSLERAASPH